MSQPLDSAGGLRRWKCVNAIDEATTQLGGVVVFDDTANENEPTHAGTAVIVGHRRSCRAP